jgi:[acyl-carrier-protein] S-malonyltransferase
LLKRLPGFTPSFLAGHSLGEYSALYCAGVLTLADTLALVTKRGELMEREGAMHPGGGMRAIIGLGIEEVEELLADFSGPGIAVVANHNTSAQVVLSGDMQGLDAIGARCVALGAKVIPLKVSVANHSPLVAGAVADFAEYMSGIPFQQPEIPILFNMTGDYEEQPQEMKAIMARQIASRVRWLEIVNRMVAAGVEVIVELGPKNVLTGMMKKILLKNSTITCLQADNPESLEKVVEALTA